MSIDPRAATGFSAAAEQYELGRPTYADAAIDRIVAGLALGDGSSVLDLAAGTGQVARLFRGRVGRVVAVEPTPAMREQFMGSTPGTTVLDGTAESIPLPDADVHAVVVGEAFHWFDIAAAAREIARVLKPHGGLALLWNTPTWTVDSTPWMADFHRILARHRESAGEYPAAQNWRELLDGTGLFEPLQHTAAAHEQSLGQGAFLAQVASWSWVANLPQAVRTSALHDVAELIRPQGRVVIPYRTDTYFGRLRGSRSTTTTARPE